MMWTDATSLCGIATLYPNDGASQANPNNGSYAQYARIDSACWGLGDGADSTRWRRTRWCTPSAR